MPVRAFPTNQYSAPMLPSSCARQHACEFYSASRSVEPRFAWPNALPKPARYYGGFIFLEEMASLVCEGATIKDNYAADQGGAIYARDATWVNSSCNLVGNGAPQGAAAYLTHTIGAATFENHDLAQNIASGGSVLYVTESSVTVAGVKLQENVASGGFVVYATDSSVVINEVIFKDNLGFGETMLSVIRSSVIATNANFQSGVALQGGSANRALQLDEESTLVAENCVFGGWLGDTVIHNANPAAGSLVLNSCGFTDSSPVMAVMSPHSNAEIRNAVVSFRTLSNAGTVNNSLMLVDRALDCRDSNACRPGGCVDSVLGVMCECIEDGACLDSGGALSIRLETPPLEVTYNPKPVFFELTVSAARDGTTLTVWNLSTFEADSMDLQAFPSNGVLSPGENVTVTVNGSPSQQDMGGNLTSRFVVTSLGGDSSSSMEVHSAFYLCGAFEYALPLLNDTGVLCEQCATIDGAEGVDCELPGATLASLPIRPGYWRSSLESLVIHSCIHPESCSGATEALNSDDYCEDGYEGPCEYVPDVLSTRQCRPGVCRPRCDGTSIEEPGDPAEQRPWLVSCSTKALVAMKILVSHRVVRVPHYSSLACRRPRSSPPDFATPLSH